MGLRRVSEIDCSRIDVLSSSIRELREKIAHLEEYTDTDVELMKLQLESMITQEKNIVLDKYI